MDKKAQISFKKQQNEECSFFSHLEKVEPYALLPSPNLVFCSEDQKGLSPEERLIQLNFQNILNMQENQWFTISLGALIISPCPFSLEELGSIRSKFLEILTDAKKFILEKPIRKKTLFLFEAALEKIVSEGTSSSSDNFFNQLFLDKKFYSFVSSFIKADKSKKEYHHLVQVCRNFLKLLNQLELFIEEKFGVKMTDFDGAELNNKNLNLVSASQADGKPVYLNFKKVQDFFKKIHKKISASRRFSFSGFFLESKRFFCRVVLSEEKLMTESVPALEVLKLEKDLRSLCANIFRFLVMPFFQTLLKEKGAKLTQEGKEHILNELQRISELFESCVAKEERVNKNLVLPIISIIQNMPFNSLSLK